ncbi:MAG: T9SS type A sorting domain-containing protein [Carboxylicivirga sp.]|jgi:hypothetical protein|nr:T9SS type A sorting domain-containing protein [Carboxylicivirga sp.]MCT4643589.1 T9SS type A sorting domain-containing protein [Carboxylicivirga sp.]
MKQLFLSLMLVAITHQAYSQNQIIADHTIVNDYDKIPDYYINEVKKMMVSIPGASHARAYRIGLEMLEDINPKFAVNVAHEEANTDQYLRCNDINDNEFVEDKWYTWYAWPENNRPSEATIVKDMISRNQNKNLVAIAFGWCWAMMSSNEGREDEVDAEHKVRWFGSSHGGPDGSLEWGIDNSDQSTTQNRVSLQTYLDATVDYINYCETNNYITKPFFTTGPVDKYTGEKAYQGYIKHERIREFVREDPSRILFDYADILCFDNDGTGNTISWTDRDGQTHTFPHITDTNVGDEAIGHIDQEGAIRLAKAMWWFLARIAGWDGGSTSINDQERQNYKTYQVNNQLFIELETPATNKGTCSVHSITGVLCHKKAISSNPIIINTGGFTPGVYLVTLDGDKAIHFKVVIK